uniref:Uncharacterized protein n=1 Tax=Anguilla anguilla TaxID=7936 RepID=A0A0E9SFN5_ANGAN
MCNQNVVLNTYGKPLRGLTQYINT